MIGGGECSTCQSGYVRKDDEESCAGIYYVSVPSHSLKKKTGSRQNFLKAFFRILNCNRYKY